MTPASRRSEETAAVQAVFDTPDGTELIVRRVPSVPKARARAVAVTLVEAADAVLMAWLRTRDSALLGELKALLRAYAGSVIRT